MSSSLRQPSHLWKKIKNGRVIMKPPFAHLTFEHIMISNAAYQTYYLQICFYKIWWKKFTCGHTFPLSTWNATKHLIANNCISTDVKTEDFHNVVCSETVLFPFHCYCLEYTYRKKNHQSETEPNMLFWSLILNHLGGAVQEVLKCVHQRWSIGEILGASVCVDFFIHFH